MKTPMINEAIISPKPRSRKCPEIVTFKSRSVVRYTLHTFSRQQISCLSGFVVFYLSLSSISQQQDSGLQTEFLSYLGFDW